MIRFGIRSFSKGFYKGNPYKFPQKTLSFYNVTRAYTTEIQEGISTGISPDYSPKDLLLLFWKKKNKGGTSPKPKQSCPTPACPPRCSRSPPSIPPQCSPPRTCPPPCPAPSPCCPPPCPPKPCPCPPKPCCPPPCPPPPCPPKPNCPPPPCPPPPCPPRPCPPKPNCPPPPKPPCATSCPKPACPPPCPIQKIIKPPCPARIPPPTPKPHPCPPPPKPSAHPPTPCCPPPKANCSSSSSDSKTSNTTPVCPPMKSDSVSDLLKDTSSKDKCLVPCQSTTEVFTKRLSILDLPNDKLPDVCPNALNEINRSLEHKCPPQCKRSSCPEPKCPY